MPAYAVVIKGTQIYDAGKGSFVDLGILDVLQIFGRAGELSEETEPSPSLIPLVGQVDLSTRVKESDTSAPRTIN